MTTPKPSSVASESMKPCRHCGERIGQWVKDGEWSHFHEDPTGNGDHRWYFCCDPSKTGKPYGLTAEPEAVR